MNCKEVLKWLSPYLDSELDPTKTFELSQHLETCARCRQRCEQEARADGLISETLKRFEPYLDWKNLEQRIRFHPNRIFSLRPLWMMGAAAAIIVLVVGISLWTAPTLAANPAKWAITELHRLSPDCSPFVAGPNCNQNVNVEAEQVLGRKLGCLIRTGRKCGRKVEIVEVVRRHCPPGKCICPDGKCRLEVRLNVNGKPVLLTIAKRQNLGQLQPINRRLRPHSTYKEDCVAYKTRYKIVARRIEDNVILAVAPNESIEDFVKQIHFQSN